MSTDRPQRMLPLVTDTCALPSTEQPLRVSEFAELWHTSVRSRERLAPTVLRVRLDPAAETGARDLCAREGECCTFLSFAFHHDGAELCLDIEVPLSYAQVLDALG